MRKRSVLIGVILWTLVGCGRSLVPEPAASPSEPLLRPPSVIDGVEAEEELPPPLEFSVPEEVQPQALPSPELDYQIRVPEFPNFRPRLGPFVMPRNGPGRKLPVFQVYVPEWPDSGVEPHWSTEATAFVPELPEWENSGGELAWNLPEFQTLSPESLSFRPEGAKLRPRSPYCMPGHSSQNFVLYSVHDGLPLHPGVW